MGEGCGAGWVHALKASSRGESLGDFMADLRGAGGTARPDDGR